MKGENEVIFSNEAEHQLTNLKEHNWNLTDASLREKFGHVLYPRLDAAILSLKSEQDFSDYERGRNDTFLLDVCDEIATIVFKTIQTNNGTIIVIEKFIWLFKYNDWFSGLVEAYSNIKPKEISIETLYRLMSEQYERYLYSLF